MQLAPRHSGHSGAGRTPVRSHTEDDDPVTPQCQGDHTQSAPPGGGRGNQQPDLPRLRLYGHFHRGQSQGEKIFQNSRLGKKIKLKQLQCSQTRIVIGPWDKQKKQTIQKKDISTFSVIV